MVNNNGIVVAIVIIIVIVIAGVYLAVQNPSPINNTSNVSNNTPQNASNQNNNSTVSNGTNSTNATNANNSTNSTNNTGNNTQTIISAQQAQKIAQTFILESGAKAGNPVLDKWSDGRLTWHVPIINSNGQFEGIGIDVDAQTGANLGES